MLVTACFSIAKIGIDNETLNIPAPSTDTKESLVAEPVQVYQPRSTVTNGIVAAKYGFTHYDSFRTRPKL